MVLVKKSRKAAFDPKIFLAMVGDGHWVGTPNSKTHFIANNDPNHVALRTEGAHATLMIHENFPSVE
jgi:hypothetical protein